MATFARIDTSAWDRVYANVRRAGNQRVGVGVFGDAELSRIFAIHEFGAPGANIPERSSLRSTLIEREPQIANYLARLGAAYFADRVTMTRALGVLGEFVVSQVKAKIRTNIPPPLRPATIARKGSSTALIDTGRMLNAIGWQILTAT